MAKKSSKKRSSDSTKPTVAVETSAKKQKHLSPPSKSPTPPPPTQITDAEIENLLTPYSKEQLIDLIVDAASSDSSIVAKIQSIADKDVSHRKIFVHGLGWDVTSDELRETFAPFGAIEECNVVVDKLTGRTKGYGFVLFADRVGATKSLKEPQKKIGSRFATCQFASIGPIPGAVGWGDTGSRKIYVSNVNAEIRADRLREFFGKFGEIETGPLGFDMMTGKSRGFALFVYKTVEGAKKALEEPHKMFEGHQLHCQKATESGRKGKGLAGVSGPFTVQIPGQLAASTGHGMMLGTGAGAGTSQPVLAAVAAAQNMAMISQNPAYTMLLSQNPLMAAALSQTALNQTGLNPTASAAFAQPALNQFGGAGLGGYGGSTSLTGAYQQGLPFGQSSYGGATNSYGRMGHYS